MALTTRVATEADSQALNEVWSWVYSGVAPADPPEPSHEGEVDVVAEVDGRIVSVAAIYNYEVARGPATMRCGGVAAVGTLAEFRDTGAAAAVMEHALRTMRDKGQVISALYGFRESYYRRFGYELCGWRWKIKCPQSRLPHLKPQLKARRVDAADVASLGGVHSAFVRVFSGSPLRDTAMWNRRLGKTPPAVYALGDPAEAYFWGKFEGFWGNLEIGEFAWSTQRGYESALALLSRLASNQETVTWYEPPASPFLARFMDHGITAEIARPTMFRCVDVPGALMALKPTSTGSLSVRVKDDLFPENVGPWHVDFSPESVEVGPTNESDFELDIRHFSQALLGSPSLQELALHGLVTAKDPHGLTESAKLLTALPVVCMEFF